MSYYFKINLTVLLFWVSGLAFPLFAQKKVPPKDVCLTHRERLLAGLINDIRKDYGKSKLPLSISLTYVAKTHIKDLKENHPDTSICNLSSWSDRGKWTPCCYNPYVVKHDCMWKKPKELTTYPYRGYEMAVWFQDTVSVDSLASLWAEQQEILDMILTRGNWEQKKWRTFGVAMDEHYVSVWFGQRADKAGKPAYCKENTPDSLQDNITVHNVAPKAYYLIFGSYDNARDAKKAVKRFRDDGFNQAGYMEANGHFRAYLSKFETLREAMAVKKTLNPKYREAWILKH